MQLTLWTYEGPPHVGAMRIATSMQDVPLRTACAAGRYLCRPALYHDRHRDRHGQQGPAGLDRGWRLRGAGRRCA